MVLSRAMQFFGQALLPFHRVSSKKSLVDLVAVGKPLEHLEQAVTPSLGLPQPQFGA